MKDFLGGNGDVIQANSGAPGVTTGGIGFGNASNGPRAGYVPQSTLWKPTVATTIATLLTKTGGAGGAFASAFGTQNASDGWGLYNYVTTAPHLFMRIGGSWADQGVTSSGGNEPQLYGMSYDGATFTARCEGSSATQSISGAITQSSVSLDFFGYGGGGGGANDYSPGYCMAFYIWNRALSASEWLLLRQTPILLQKPRMTLRGTNSAAATYRPRVIRWQA